MNESFYVGAIGASMCTKRLSVIANNLANVNNAGFKPKLTAFQELIEYNINDSEDAVTELQAGASMKLARTYNNFEVEAFTETRSECDYCITLRNTFFMLQDPETGAITYTRDGHFHRSQMEDGNFYLMTDNDKYVLDQNGEPMRAITSELTEAEKSAAIVNQQEFGLYTFDHPSRLLSTSANEYVPSDDDAQAIPVGGSPLVQGFLESSGTNTAAEFSYLIECQRAYSFATKMVITSDEITNTINNLRG